MTIIYPPNHIVQAPTGSGKSIIIMTAAGVLAENFDIKSYILCSDLYLYKQYEDFIDAHPSMGFGYLKGQTGNYICSKENCDIRNAPCTMCGYSFAEKFKYFECANTCEYLQERLFAVNAKVTVMTYQNFHFQMNINTTKVDTHNIPLFGIFQYRDMIWCDECHNIPSIVQNKCRPTINKNDLNLFLSIYNYYKSPAIKKRGQTNYVLTKFPEAKNVSDLFNHYMKEFGNMKLSSYQDTINLLNYTRKLVDVINIAATRIQSSLKNKYSNGLKLTEQESKIWGKITYLQNYHCYLDDFCRSIELTGFHYTVKQRNDDGFIFSCVKEDGMISTFLFSHNKTQNCQHNTAIAKQNWAANKNNPEERHHYKGISLFSATCGDMDSFVDNIGFKHLFNPKYKFIDIDSTFDFSTSPIYICNDYKLNFNNKQKNLPILANFVNKIVNLYINKNGIIHTGSYDIAKKLYDLVDDNVRSRILIYKDSETKKQCIEKINNNSNYILIGPSLNEGIDLPFDLCRFIITLKIPYLSMGDKYVNKKMRMFKKWYSSVAMNNLIQGIGRGNRAYNDQCDCWIIDGCFKRLYSLSKKQVPYYISKRFIFVDENFINNLSTNQSSIMKHQLGEVV